MTANTDGVPWVSVSPDMLARAAEFAERGFVVSPTAVVSADAVAACKTHLDAVLKHEFDRGQPPTKVPKYIVDKLDKNDKRRRATQQVINIRHCDTAFQRLVHDPNLGRLVASLAGWRGARVAQDQVWVKPPGAAALTFHRDTPYFAFEPSRVVTVWITFDDLASPEADALGPLEYYPGSHLWDAKSGIAGTFFDKGYRDHLKSAAAAEGLGDSFDEAAIVKVRTPAGGLSIHDGRTWHGSGGNTSAGPRRGIGIHYVAADVVFRDGWLPPQWEAVRAKHNRAVAEARKPPQPSAEVAEPVADGEQAEDSSAAAAAPPVDNFVPEWECPVVWRAPVAEAGGGA